MDEVNEGSTAYLEVTFKDATGAQFAPASVSYRIDDVITATSIRADTPVTPAPSITITLEPADNAVVNASIKSEVHRVTITAPFGVSEQLQSQYDYLVRNLEFV